MTEPLDRGIAASVVAVAVYEIWKAYTSRAPGMTALSAGVPGGETHQALQDADYAVGGLAVIAGLAMFFFTRDVKILVLVLVTFASVALWHHAVLNRTPERAP